MLHINSNVILISQWVLAIVGLLSLALVIDIKSHLVVLCIVCVIATISKRKIDDFFTSNSIPGKTIWLLNWKHFTRFEDVKQSWVEHNPGWNVIVIDSQNVDAYVSHEWQDRDAIRHALITLHGGVVVDNDMMCMMPLENWVYDLLKFTGFWAYTNPDGNGYVTNFMVAKQGSEYSKDIPVINANDHLELLLLGREKELDIIMPYVMRLPASNEKTYTLTNSSIVLPHIYPSVTFNRTVCVSPVCDNSTTLRTFADICKDHDIQLIAYDKCNFCKHVPTDIYTRPRRNVGRDMETYLSFVIDHYYNLPEHIIFCPANEKHNRVARFREIARNVTPSHCDHLDDLAKGFNLDSYEGVALVPAVVRPLHAWIEKYIGPWDTVKNKSAICWNGIMRTTRDKIHQHTKSFYEALHIQTTIHNNTEVAHYMERVMGLVF